MIYKSNYYENLLNEKNNKIIYGTSAPRGRILDRNGNIIVDNVGVKTRRYKTFNCRILAPYLRVNILPLLDTRYIEYPYRVLHSSPS